MPRPQTSLQTFDVYVSNLPLEANERNVGKLFTKYGEIKSVFVKQSTKESGQKYAFVRFLCEPDAERAVEEQNGIEIANRKIYVKICDQKKKGITPDKEVKSCMVQEPKGFKRTPDIVPVEERGGAGMMQTSRESQDERMSVMVTHVESPISMWVQIVSDENTQKLFDMTEQLRSLCPAAPKVNGKPEQSKVYAAKFSEDQMWYRCCVKNFFGSDQIKVQYIDYGNTEDVEASALVEIPQSLAVMSPLAQKLLLHNIKAKDGNNQNGIHFLQGLTEGQIMSAQKIRHLADSTGFYANLNVEGNSVGDLIIQKGFAVLRPPLNNRQPVSGHAGDSCGPTGGTGQVTGTGSRGHKEQSDDQILRSELSKKKRDLERIRTEKDVATMELNAMKRKIKGMQEDYSALSNKVVESTLTHKMQTLVSLSDKVRKLRCQFPSGKTSVLEVAIALARSSEKVQNSSVTTLQPVISTLKTFEAAQKEISNCSDMNELKELISARNEARLNMFEKLKACVEELSQMPVEERRMDVKKTEQELRENYSGLGSFVVHSHPSLDDLLPGFKDWKSKKNSEFCDVRKITNHYQKAIDKALTQYQQLLNIDDPAVVNCDVDLENLMKLYTQALQNEISITDTEHSRDSGLVATVMATVSKELNNELRTLENLTQMKSEFTQLKRDVEPWLHVRPNLTELQEVRKLIRSLKSKLRHKMADKQDLEEGDGSEEELESLRRNVEEIKHDLHKSLCVAETLLADLSVITSSHFPELAKQYADLGINIQMAYSGLMKIGREIDHYSLTPALVSGSYKSVFAGDSVLVREFHIGDSDHITKEDFMQQVTHYNTAAKKCTNLLSVDAVFFNKMDRQAYIQMPWTDGQTLELLYTSSTLSEKMIQQIIKGVLEAVSALHAFDIIHGEINPSNVIFQDNSVVLLSPDFSKHEIDRSKKKFTTESDMEFQSPEVLAAVTPFTLTKSSDLYNIGLLILWLQYPDSIFSSKFDGTPDISSLSMDPDLLSMMSNMLLGNPGARSAIGSWLPSPYLTKTIEEPVIEPLSIDQFVMEPFPVAEDIRLPSDIGTTAVTLMSTQSSGGNIYPILPAGDAASNQFECYSSMSTSDFLTSGTQADLVTMTSGMKLITDDSDGEKSKIESISSDMDTLLNNQRPALTHELPKEFDNTLARDTEQSICTDFMSNSPDVDEILGRKDSPEVEQELKQEQVVYRLTEEMPCMFSPIGDAESGFREKGAGDCEEVLKMPSNHQSFPSERHMNTQSPLQMILNLTAENGNVS